MGKPDPRPPGSTERPAAYHPAGQQPAGVLLRDGKGGRLSRIRYPSGRTATWHYRADGSLSQLRTTYAGSTQTLLKIIGSPTGQPERLSYGNGLVERRSYDLAGQLTQINRNALGKLDYRYDPTGNITQIGTQTYAYDTLDRLTQAPSRSYAYDANGNPMSDGRYSYTYDSQNRLTEVQQGATVQVRSTYNALGQRVRKETAAGTTHYLYSTEGQLLAELDAQGNTQREYLYLHAWPVAVVSYTPAVPAGSGTAALLAGDAAAETAEDYPEVAETAPADPKPTTSSGATTSGATDRAADGAATSTAAATPATQLHYLHPDHLGTPRLATDSAQRVVWRWDSAPFGDTPAQEDPDGDGVRVTLNLRFPGQYFPGQYFDAETGLHYNYFRDYDPVVGRYLESDPVGLRGGVNTYGYVGGRPLVAVDPRGLVEWNGTVNSISVIPGGGAARYYFDLVSNCVKGKRGKVSVVAGGFAVGFGASATGSTSTITFEDNLTYVHPMIFQGEAKFAGIGYAFIGIAYSAYAIQLGGATAIGHGHMVGFDASISAGVGVSTVTLSCS